MILHQMLNKKSIFLYLLGFYFISLVLGALNTGRLGSLLRLVALLPVLWWFIFSHRITFNRVTLCATLFLGFSFISWAWSIAGEFSFLSNITPLLLLLLLYAVSGYKYSDKELAFLRKSLVWASRFTVLILLLLHNQWDSRLTLSEGTLQEDPNYLCSYFLFGIVYAVEKILTDKKSRRGWYLLELGIYLITIFATGSRGGLFAIIVAALVAALGQLVQNKISVKTVLLPLVLLGGILVAITLLPHFLPEQIWNRFSAQSIIESQGTGRYQIWKDYLYIFSDSTLSRQLFGYGYGVLPLLAQSRRLLTFHVAHNIFIEYLISFGVVGLSCYLLYLWQFLRLAWRRQEIFSLAVLLGMIALTLSTSYNGKAYWNILIYLVCLSKWVSTRPEEKL